MTTLLFFTRAAVVLGAALLAVAAMRRAPAAARRWVLVLALLATLFTPLLSALVPESSEASGLVLKLDRVPLFEGDERVPTSAAATVNEARAPESPYASTTLGLTIYVLGAALVLGRTLGAQRKARRLARLGIPYAHGVVLSAAVDVPAVVGVTSATVLLPLAARTWSPARIDTVLLHERAHVQQRDGLALLMARLACALYWPLPLVWMAARRLRRECELAADERVVQTGVARTAYASELIAFARAALRPVPQGALGMASELESRVRALLSPPATPWTRLRFGLLCASSIALVVATCLIREARSTARADVTRAHEPRVQAVVDEEAARALREWSAKSVVALVLDPRTGAVLASSGDVEQPVVPGSTMKPFTIAAALDAKVIEADGSFRCETSPRTYGKRTLRDGASSDRLDLGGVLAVSSNVCTSRIYDKLGGAALLAALQRLHFGERPGALPQGLADGSFEGALVAAGVGVSATPLQVAAGYASLVHGEYRSPGHGASAAERVLTEQTARTVRGLLAQVVYSPTGTGQAAAASGVRVIGKTGTSEIGEGAATYASFVGLAPAEEPQLVVYVGITAPRGGATGGKSAAPVFARIVSRVLAR